MTTDEITQLDNLPRRHSMPISASSVRRSQKQEIHRNRFRFDRSENHESKKDTT